MSYKVRPGLRKDVCRLCKQEFDVWVQRRSKDEEIEFTDHLCQDSHILTWDYGDHKQARFSASNVQFPVFLSPEPAGMVNTVDQVDLLDQVAIKTLEAVFRVEVAPYTSSFDVKNVIKGYVQNEWYVAAKGAIPLVVHRRQEERVAKAKEAKAGNGDGATKEKTPRVGNTYKIATGKTEEIKMLKGQAAQVVQALKAVGKGDAKLVGQELVKNPDFKTKQDPARVAGYYFKSLSEQGLIERVGA